jgi:hypothetical protein
MHLMPCACSPRLAPQLLAQLPCAAAAVPPASVDSSTAQNVCGMMEIQMLDAKATDVESTATQQMPLRIRGAVCRRSSAGATSRLAFCVHSCPHRSITCGLPAAAAARHMSRNSCWARCHWPPRSRALIRLQHVTTSASTPRACMCANTCGQRSPVGSPYVMAAGGGHSTPLLSCTHH